MPPVLAEAITDRDGGDRGRAGGIEMRDSAIGRLKVLRLARSRCGQPV